MLSDKNYISFGWISAFWERVKKYISDAIQPSGEKEVYTILTAGAFAPSTASDGDLYINTSNNRLYKYTSGSWVVDSDDTKTEAVYVAGDTGHVWTYNGTSFADSGGQMVDNTIYLFGTNGLDDLKTLHTEGLYTVVWKPSSSSGAWYVYTLIMKDNSAPYATYMLSNKDGYKTRRRWSPKMHPADDFTAWADAEWTEFVYASQAQLSAEVTARNAAIEEAKEELLPLIYAGL